MKSIPLILLILTLISLQSYGIRSAGWLPADRAPIFPFDRAVYAMRYGKKALPLIEKLPNYVPPGAPVYGWWLEDYRIYALPVPLVGTIYGPLNHIDCAHDCKTPLVFSWWLRSHGIEYLLVDPDRRFQWEPYCHMTGLPADPKGQHDGFTLLTARGHLRLWKIIP